MRSEITTWSRPDSHVDDQESLASEQHHGHIRAHSEPILSPRRSVDSQNGSRIKLIRSRTSDASGLSQAICSSAKSNLIARIHTPSAPKNDVSRSAIRQKEDNLNGVGSYGSGRRTENSASTRSSRSIDVQYGEHDETASRDNSNQDKMPAGAIVPPEVLKDFQALYRSRARMSYHWTTYREQYKYVRQERNAVASTIAVMEQELEENPPGSVRFDANQLRNLASVIRQGHAELASSEAALDGIQDTMLEEEQHLRSAERQLRSRLKGDDVSDSSDIFDEILSAVVSLPARPQSDATPISANMIIQRLSGQRQGSSQQRTGGLDIDPPTLGSLDAALLFDEARNVSATKTPPSSVSTFKRAMVYQANAMEHPGTDAAISYVGAQFPLGGQSTKETSDTSRALVEPNPLQTSKRTRDLDVQGPSLKLPNQADCRDLVVGYNMSGSDLSPNMVARMLQIVKWSWLEFSAFVHVLGSEWKFIKKYDILEIDTLLQQIVWSSGISPSRSIPMSNTASQTSLRAQESNQILPQASVAQRPASDQSLQRRTSASSLYRHQNVRRGYQNVRRDRGSFLLRNIVIAVSSVPEEDDQRLHQEQATYTRAGSEGLPSNNVL